MGRVARGTVVIALIASGSAWAATNGDGDLVTNFDGSLRPATLPRATPAPVTVRVEGSVKSASGDVNSIPQLLRIAVAITRGGQLFDRGLPVCNPQEIQPASTTNARALCGGAIVGHGEVRVQVRTEGQPSFFVHGRLLAFNGPRRGGEKLILAQVYAPDPPGAFLLPFRVRKSKGTFGTLLTTTLPRRARKWAYLTHFEMSLHRLYTYRGERRSYVSAACAAPTGFDEVLFPLARATYTFADGRRFSMSQSASCRVAG